MDKGAHFYRCDFQVHTPRDLRWNGTKHITDADRLAYAKVFIQHCRTKGIDAVAITDHHDLTFFNYIKQASLEETDEHGKLIESEKRITVFPGIEVTLATPPCQVLVILDANFPEDQFSRILNKLSLNPNGADQPSTAPTQPIPQGVINDLEDLYIKFDTIDTLKGKYTVLPNVGDGGHKTLLRAGFSEYYKKMPCVGGYIDGSVTSLGTGNQNILNGRDVNYGNKALALFQTSDNRKEDCSDLGKHTTWVKWAEPTAEAIRQACLAKQSRISQVQPELPQIFIKSIDVTTSKFLGSFSFELNRQYNAFIGGRGTGKSTILEYIRWGLCDQTKTIADLDELSVVERKRQSLLQKTLIDVDGEVRITVEVNGIAHIVKRNSKEILLKIGNGTFQAVKEEDVRKLLPIQSYSQKQLSDVGVKTEELKRFIEQPITGSLNSLKFQIQDAIKKLTTSYVQLIRKKELEQEIENNNLETKSLTSQVESLRSGLSGMEEGDQAIISKKPKYDTEQNIVLTAKAEMGVFEEKADELLELLKSYPEPFGSIENLENTEIFTKLQSEVNEKFSEIKLAVQAFKDIFSEQKLTNIKALIDEWEGKKTQFEESYETAKGKAQSSQQQLQEIQKIENRLAEIAKITNERKTILKEIANPEQEFSQNKELWIKLHQSKVELLNSEASKFSKLSNNLIKAEITKSIDLKSIKQNLKQIFEGTRIQEPRIDAVLNFIATNADPIKAFCDVMDEFKILAEFKFAEDKAQPIPETPILTNTCEYSEEHRAKICKKMTSDDWMRLSSVELEFNPEFSYSTNNALGDVIPFAEASAGQQATALLTVLLNQPGIPLIIDQPEDDIDNRAIETIVNNIWEAKKKRQLIFTSHNANLVVNGDAELVICCDYKEASSQTRGIIKCEGAIDTKAVREEITSVMEGGERAFKLRKDKYGF